MNEIVALVKGEVERLTGVRIGDTSDAVRDAYGSVVGIGGALLDTEWQAILHGSEIIGEDDHPVEAAADSKANVNVRPYTRDGHPVAGYRRRIDGVARTAEEALTQIDHARRDMRWQGRPLEPHGGFKPLDPLDVPVADPKKWEHVYQALDAAVAENRRNEAFNVIEQMHGPQALVVTDSARASQQGAFNTHGGARVTAVAQRMEDWIRRDQERVPLDQPANFVAQHFGLASALRHEYGHKVENSVLTPEQRSAVLAMIPTDQDQVAHGLSAYATFPGETIPELFALVTDPSYDQDNERWPDWVVQAGDRLLRHVVDEHWANLRDRVET